MADCGPVNPLANLSKAQTVDNSLQRDRFAQAGPSTSSLRHLPSRAPPPQQQQRPSTGSPQPFDLTSLQQSIQHNHQPGPPPEWARDFGAFHAAPGPSSVQQQAPQDWQRGMEAGWGRASPAGPNSIQHHPQHQQQPDFSAWDSAFVNQQSQPSALHHQHPHPSQSIYQQQPLYQPSFQPTHFATSRPFLPPAQQLQQQPELTVLDKGKGKEETSWDHHFATYENLQAEGPQKEEQKEEDKEGEEKEKTGEDWTDAQKEVDKLEAIWNEHRNGTVDAPKTDADLASWEAEFSQFANGSVASAFEEMEADQARRHLEELGGLEDDEAFRNDVLGTEDEQGFPRLGRYTFESTNPYLTHPSPLALLQSTAANPLSSLSNRALILEAAIQAPSLPKDGLEEAALWRQLGMVQTQDEKELAGMRALEEAVRMYGRAEERGEFNEGMGRERERREMGEGLMSLAISYTNESYDRAAYSTLERHLHLLHPSFARPSPSPPQSAANPWALHGVLTECYLDAARAQMARGEVDPGTQMALGLLFFSNGQHEQSADCWGTALSVTPDDFLLWNRLGATLANGGRPEEAIDAYRRALEINPTFTRAVYNLGVSCLNIGVYREAAEHLLLALSLHQTNDSPDNKPPDSLLSPEEKVNQSQNLWSTLRRAFYSMDRPDLAELARPETDLSAFRGEFEF